MAKIARGPLKIPKDTDFQNEINHIKKLKFLIGLTLTTIAFENS